MNALSLRISGTGSKKAHSTAISVVPVVFPDDKLKYYDSCTYFIKVMLATTVDEQLLSLKSILNGNEPLFDENLCQFLVLIFLEAETKHPVKCFLTRYITKTKSLQEPFSAALAAALSNMTSTSALSYQSYVSTVSKLSCCLENFPAGARAIKIEERIISEYLVKALLCCVDTLRNPICISPTEKNEMFNLCHLGLRILLHIIQKVTLENQASLSPMFEDIRSIIDDLMVDEDVPMDTKSLSGLLLLTMYLVDDGEDSWIDILKSNKLEHQHHKLMSHKAGELSVLAAIATVVSVDRLLGLRIDGESALVALLQSIIEIGERTTSESTFTLLVTRTVVQLSRSLGKVTEHMVGLRLVDSLLMFVWTHLEHHLDSVRHLTAQALNNVVKYCGRVDRAGNPHALNSLFSSLLSLERSRKSYYVVVTALGAELGAACLLDRIPGLVSTLLDALSVQAVQASATVSLQTLVKQHMVEASPAVIQKTWSHAVLRFVRRQLETGVLSVLKDLLAAAARDCVLLEIESFCKKDTPLCGGDLKCVLILLNVAKKSGVAAERASAANDQLWRGLIEYDVLKRAAVDSVEETRILSLSLIVDSSKSTEIFTRGDFDFILYYIKYNINSQSPNFRQLTLSYLKKFVKRLADSHRALKRRTDQGADSPSGDYYQGFMETLRAACFASLLPGANYSRRCVALQVLAWCGQARLDGYKGSWTEDYAETMLLQLEDTYENNKMLALEILEQCPSEIMTAKKYSISLSIEDILRQASAVKPTECVSAAYKLKLVRKKLPHLVHEQDSEDVPNRTTYGLLHLLLRRLKAQLCLAKENLLVAAAQGPMYGLLHCMRHLFRGIDAEAISSSLAWTDLVASTIVTCMKVNGAVAPVVNNSSPEGHLPMDIAEPGAVRGTPYGVRLDDGSQVTAQMVLLCAWRSVKEVSLLLGELSSCLSISGEGASRGSISRAQLELTGEHFTRLLAESKHRGAFEQAHVGFSALLTRLWRCRSPALHGLPRAWLAELMEAIYSGENSKMCATRRSAGVPFMIQALVTTELQVNGNPKCFHSCMTALLNLAHYQPSLLSGTTARDLALPNSTISVISALPNTTVTTAKSNDTTSVASELPNDTISEDSALTNDSTNVDSALPSDTTRVEARTHAINILRALFRNTTLGESAACYVGKGLLLAIDGFDARTWPERNSATLLFSALMVRIFGVQRSKDADTLCIRNKMTGRIFFLRYPELYDYMLEKLKEVSSSDETQQLRPSLYPVLLLLARLYPSSLEGTVSNLKLVAFIPHVLACAGSCVLKTRQLAAKAMPPLISPDHYISHLQEMFILLSDPKIKKNFCHGILLQVIRLLDAKPENIKASNEQLQTLSHELEGSIWIVDQTLTDKPCYVVADEYVKVINLFIWRFPGMMPRQLQLKIESTLKQLLFYNTSRTVVNSGKDVFLANATYLLFILENMKTTNQLPDFIVKSLRHSSYEIVLSTLNYLLILHNKYDDLNICKFLAHLNKVTDNSQVLIDVQKNKDYIANLCHVLKYNIYLECVQKSLKVLTLEKGTQTKIVEIKCNATRDEEIMLNLLYCIRNEHENLTHIYLESLLNLTIVKLTAPNMNKNDILDIVRVIFGLSSSENNDNVRQVVADFLDSNFEALLRFDTGEFTKGEKFEFNSTLFSTLITLLEDDMPSIRQKTSDIIVRLTKPGISENRLIPVKGILSAAREDANEPTEDQTPFWSTENAKFVDQNDESEEQLIPSRSAELLREYLQSAGDLRHQVAMLVVLALLDFKSEVCMTDDVSEECRVFDQNERYNIFLEETIWTRECCDLIKNIIQQNLKENIVDYLQSLVNDDVYKSTLIKLCGSNLKNFKEMLSKKELYECKNDLLNPKIQLFVNRLHL